MYSLLFKHLKEISKYHPEIYNNLKVEIDIRFYWYWPQNKYWPENRNMYYKLLLSKVGPMIVNSFKAVLSGIYRLFMLRIPLFSKKWKNSTVDLKKEKVMIGDRLFFLDQNLEKIWFDVIDSPRWFWWISNIKMFIQTMKIKRRLFYWNFKEITSKDFIDMILGYKKKLKKFIQDNNIKALFVNNNVNFFESLSIDIFEELGKPSFEFVHGLPGAYSGVPSKRPNYKLVWWERMKENFIKIWWMDSNKILISWHPYYNTLSDKELRFGLDDVLVLCKAFGWWWSVMAFPDLSYSIVWDIWNSIWYLYSVENILKKHWVKSARLRPHPCESINRYKKFINTDFFILDEEPLSQSLTKASLVIWPSSTVLLEAIYYNVNYLLYEPQDKDKIDLMNRPLITPNDWSDPKVPVAKNEDELDEIIKFKKRADKTIFNDYIKTPFDISFLKWIIK